MSEWVRISIEAEPVEGSMTAVTVGGKRLILYRTAAGYFATDRRCTHQGADLLRGYFDQDVIECPVHQGRFSISTGEALSAPACVALKVYAVKEADGGIYVRQE
jgi:nitrite reductase/ring-hydroxylating ferredoxin subunit